MGRHRRGNIVPAPVPVTPERRAEDSGRHRGSHRKRSAAPIRTGLLGASAAMAMGAVAVASGLIPGPSGSYTIGGSTDPGDIRADGLADLETQGGVTPPAGGAEESSPSRGEDLGGSRDAGPAHASTMPGATPSEKPGKSAESAEATPSQSTPPADDVSGTPSAEPTEQPSQKSGDPGGGGLDAESAAEAAVLRLVNEERAAAGCGPVTADAALAELAGDFSEDMAVQGFFSHDSPNGDSPWDRAEAAGISNLGGENIARGQADAESVMDAWMNSPGHRANILNCDYKTLGVGAHFAEGGPWWTQNFGF